LARERERERGRGREGGRGRGSDYNQREEARNEWCFFRVSEARLENVELNDA
jgi:hypothetical protein